VVRRVDAYCRCGAQRKGQIGQARCLHWMGTREVKDSCGFLSMQREGQWSRRFVWVESVRDFIIEISF
jgi:hypothetical protein